MRILKVSIIVLLCFTTFLVGCTKQDEGYGYKPAIMINDTLYWLDPSGNVNTIPEDFIQVGVVEMSVKSPGELPTKNFQCTSANDNQIGWKIYASDVNTQTIFTYREETNQYVPFILEEQSK